MLILIEKLLSRCANFFRLEAILGDRPNVHPPYQFDSGLSQGETVQTVERLIDAIGGKENLEERGRKDGDSGEEEARDRGWRWSERGRVRESGREFVGEGDGVERGQEAEENEFEEPTGVEALIQGPLLQELIVSENEFHEEEEKERDDDIRILEGRRAGDLGREGGEREERSQEERERELRTKSPERQGRHST